jgi:hypothetical protein
VRGAIVAVAGQRVRAAGGWIGRSGDAGGGLFAEQDVAAEAGKVLVAGLGLKLGSGAAVGDRRYPRMISCGKGLGAATASGGLGLAMRHVSPGMGGSRA